MDVTKITNDQFLKNMNNKEMEALASDIRSFIIDLVSEKGGHLSSNLGDVELIMALHKVFNLDEDYLLFDVGHQAYTHKILTGRAKDFANFRELNGLSGFLNSKESKYDIFESGHSSTSISTAMGMARARDENKKNYNIIAFIGDSSIANGVAFEALNNLANNHNKIIIILNDNGMGINKSVGAMSKFLSKVRVSNLYNKTKNGIKKVFSFAPGFIDFCSRLLHRIVLIIRSDTIFDKFNISYLGPINGHNFKALEKALKKAKNFNQSIIVHVKTIKGYGYDLAEKDEEGKFHGIGAFNKENGNEYNTLKDNEIAFTSLVSKNIEEILENDPKAYLVSSAMVYSTNLNDCFKKYNKRCIDVGIAEEHAIAYANGLAIANMHPIVSMYSTFMQRGYDEIVHDVCRINSNITFLVDRAGIVGKDGKTHQGIYDVSFLYPLENSIICSLSEGKYLKPLLKTLNNINGPKFIRYQKGKTLNENYDKEVEFAKFIFENYDPNNKISLIVPGTSCKILKDIIINNNYQINLINPIFLKPLDVEALEKISNTKVYIYDNTSVFSGFSSAILKYYNEKNKNITIYTLKDEYITFGEYNDVLKSLGMDEITILNKVLNDGK